MAESNKNKGSDLVDRGSEERYVAFRSGELHPAVESRSLVRIGSRN